MTEDAVRAARRALEAAKNMLSDRPTLESTKQAVQGLWALQPDTERKKNRINDELLRG